MQKKAVLLLFSTVIFAFVNGVDDLDKVSDSDERSFYKCWTGCLCLLEEDVRNSTRECLSHMLSDVDLDEAFRVIEENGYVNFHIYRYNYMGLHHDYCNEDEDFKEEMFNKTVTTYTPYILDACKKLEPACDHFSKMMKCFSKIFEEEKKKNNCGHSKNEDDKII